MVDVMERVLPSHSDPAGRGASNAIGGPWGRHGDLGRQWFWTPLRVLFLLTLFTLALGWAQKSPCQTGNWNLSQPVAQDGGGVAYVDGKQYVDLCYSDIIPLFGAEGLYKGDIPYIDHNVEYPVLTGLFMYTAAKIAAGYDEVAAHVSFLPHPPAVQTYYEVTAFLLAICALTMVWAVARIARRRVWDTAMVALSPVVLVHAFTNWDLFAAALATTGMLAWARRRPGLAGVLLGLGAAAKLYPLFLLGPLLVLCVRTRKLKEFGVTLGTAVLSWGVVNAPFALLWTDNWKRFFDLNSERPADPDSLWNVGQYLDNGKVIDVGLLNVGVALAFAAVCVGVAWLALAAQRRPRVAQLAFLVVAGFLLTNKVWSPQYSIWLVPLAVLARPSWRHYIVWQLTEALLWFTRMYWWLQFTSQAQRDNPQHHYQVLVRGLDERWFIICIIARDLLVLGYAVLIVRDILRPSGDVVRSSGDDDPTGGVLDGAPDRFVLGRPPDDEPALVADGVSRNTT